MIWLKLPKGFAKNTNPVFDPLFHHLVHADFPVSMRRREELIKHEGDGRSEKETDTEPVVPDDDHGYQKERS
jgi:hypothetical protein